MPGPPNRDHLRGGIDPAVERGDAGPERERVGARADDQLEPADGGSLDREGGPGGGFGGPAGRRLRLERQLPRPCELVSSRTWTSSIVTSRIRNGRDHNETEIDGDPDPARPKHERLGPPGSVRERNVGGRERRREGDRQLEGARDLHVAPDGLAGASLDASAQPSGHDRSRCRTRGDHRGGENDRDQETTPPRGHAPRCTVPSCHPWPPSPSPREPPSRRWTREGPAGPGPGDMRGFPTMSTLPQPLPTTAPENSPASTVRQDLSRTTLAVMCLLLLIATTLWILRPFLTAGIWATMVVVSTWPLLKSLQARLGNRRAPAVALMTLGLLLLLILPLWRGDRHHCPTCRRRVGPGEVDGGLGPAAAAGVGGRGARRRREDHGHLGERGRRRSRRPRRPAGAACRGRREVGAQPRRQRWAACWSTSSWS